VLVASYLSIADSLPTDHVIILDTNHEVFVWIGERSKNIERRLALETALEYLKKSR
jgi:hypothetical protein